MNRLPDPQQPTTTAGQPLSQEDADREAKRIISEALLSYRDPSPVPPIGATPPVAQPGIPPMSQRATDISRILIAAGVASVPPGLIAIGVLVASEHADPTVIGLICAAPVALAVPIIAIASLLRRAKETIQAAPPEHHHHYAGNVHQDHTVVTTQTRGVWAKTRNELPR